MSDTATPENTRRAPNGCSASLHIALSPDERQQIDELARSEHRSTGSTARLLLLRGLRPIESSPNQSLAIHGEHAHV